MKKVELLAPAGNMEMLKYAIMAGCDAVYLGGTNFGARAFSKNFNDEEIINAINYAHLYGVKVYVTVNTLIYDDEVNDFLNYVEFLHKNNVDAIIIQDFGMFDLIRKVFPNLELHCSTQMHIHNLDGTLLMEKLGAKRVVLARETSIDTIKLIKEKSDIELEIFVHGSLCVSYSGQCLMSSLIGGRSGNRGTCAGSCRLKYDILDEDNRKLNNGNYPLSMKDLNTIEHIGTLLDLGISSLKIEGRMKSPPYVYMVVSLYRQAIDSYYRDGLVKFNDNDLLKLRKIFNREYTKGFIFNELNSQVINQYTPNHRGVRIGTVIDYRNGIAKIRLSDTLTCGSGLRIKSLKKEVGVMVNEFYVNNKLVKEAYEGDIISIKVNDVVNSNDIVLITMDNGINKEIKSIIENNPRKVMINGRCILKIGNKIEFSLNDGINEVVVFGNIVNKAINKSISYEDIVSKLDRLGNSIYKYSNLDIVMDDNIFVNYSELNNLRQDAICKLNELRQYKINYRKDSYYIDVRDYPRERRSSILIDDKYKYDRVKDKYDIIYSEVMCDNTIRKVPRVIDGYNMKSPFLAGEIGSLYKNKNIYTDFSLNVTNAYTVAFLHSLGADMVTLSYELNDIKIRELIDNYHRLFNCHPNVSVISSAYEEVMVSKFSLNKFYNKDKLYLRDMFGNKYLVRTKNGVMYIYNYKKRNNNSNKYYDMGVNEVRVNDDTN